MEVFESDDWMLLMMLGTWRAVNDTVSSWPGVTFAVKRSYFGNLWRMNEKEPIRSTFDLGGFWARFGLQLLGDGIFTSCQWRDFSGDTLTSSSLLCTLREGLAANVTR